VIAVLSVTIEWSQRSGLTTFTLVPHRGHVIAAKAIACVGVAIVSIPLGFAIGARNIVGTSVAGIDPVWDVTVTNMATVTLANVLGLLGLHARHTHPELRARPGGLLRVLVPAHAGRHPRGLAGLVPAPATLDRLKLAGRTLKDGTVSAQQWAHLAVTSVIWLLIPLAIGLALVPRAEVK
jgi:ABC-2 type transport system permease protein